MNFNDKITKMRKKEKLSQEELAEQLGVTRQTISNWELNVTQPNISQVKKLSKIFNTSIDELLDNDVRDILEKKISDTEKITKKTRKSLKIIIITLYFIILSVLIGIIIYYCTNRDFTSDYQTDFTCTIKDVSCDVFVEFYDEEGLIVEDKYLIGIGICDNDGCSKETYNAGDSIYSTMESLKIIKKMLLNKGATCK